MFVRNAFQEREKSPLMAMDASDSEERGAAKQFLFAPLTPN